MKHYRSKFNSTLLIALTVLDGRTAFARQLPAPTAGPEATVSITDTMPAGPVARFDFGTVPAGQQSILKHTFRLVNRGKAIQITQLRPSCGCTSAIIADDKKGQAALKLPLLLETEKEIAVEVSMRPSALGAGSYEKRVSVYTENKTQPAFVLNVLLTVLPSAKGTPTEKAATGTATTLPDAGLRFSPGTLNFETVPPGQGHTLRLTLYYPDNLAGGKPLELVSSNPSVTVKQVKDGGAQANLEGRKPGQRTQEFDVTVLKTAASGALTGYISLKPTPSLSAFLLIPFAGQVGKGGEKNVNITSNPETPKTPARMPGETLLDHPAPPFTLPGFSYSARTDTAGPLTAHSMPQTTPGQNTVLFFFCGCEDCLATAAAWSQQSNTGAPAHTCTIIVFAGEAMEARAFAHSTGLETMSPTLLLDPDDHITEDLYHVASCPRSLVLSDKGIVQFIGGGPAAVGDLDKKDALAA